jgi:hydroxyacylglutathione hydrolase
MHIQQIYTACLSEASYIIESEGEIAVIDPIRDIDVYLQKATALNAKIKYVFETHFHADFVSGHLDLAQKTGAPIIYGPGAKTNFTIHNATHGEVFKLGKLTLTAIHTPGHTLESTCYLLKTETNKDHAIFTGDTLFIGDVGRPDLSSGNLSSEDLAGIMYDTLQTKILPLADDVIVYPAHGAGSSCGKNLSTETVSTIGQQKQTNYALKITDKDAFIKEVTTGLADAPTYFAVNAKINAKGYTSVFEVVEKALQPLTIAEFTDFTNNGAVIVDTRTATEFTQGFIPGSMFIGLEGRFAEWAGSLLSFTTPIVVVTPPGQENETILRLARVGLDNVVGYLNGGFTAWQNANQPIDLIIDVEPDELAMDLPFDANLLVVDVRKETEYEGGHVKNALNLPLHLMTDTVELANLEEDQTLYVHCAGGYRSVIAASILKREGYHNLRNVLGGYAKIKEQKTIKTESKK